MKRWVYARRVTTGDPERLDDLLQGRIGELLKAIGDPVEDSAGIDGSVGVRLEAPLPGVPAKTIRVVAGVGARPDGLLRIPLHWHAEPGRAAFPEFDGALELQPLSSSSAELTVLGAYTVPLGPVGAAVNATVLAGAAQRTAERLVDRLSRALEDAAASPGRRRRAATAASFAPRVADVMTPDPVLLAPELPIRAAALLLLHRRIRGAPVVSDSGELIGVLSETDILATEARRGRGGDDASAMGARVRTVGQACTRPARVTVAEAALSDAARAMLEFGVGRLVVVDGSRIAGIVTRHDVLSGLLRSDVEVHASVEDALHTLAESQVVADVRWGVVRLSGSVSDFGRLQRIVDAVDAVPGVAAVDVLVARGGDGDDEPSSPPDERVEAGQR